MCSLPHQEWGGDAWSELLHSCRNQGAGAEALAVQGEQKGSVQALFRDWSLQMQS